jgi:hypothetical protein
MTATEPLPSNGRVTESFLVMAVSLAHSSSFGLIYHNTYIRRYLQSCKFTKKRNRLGITCMVFAATNNQKTIFWEVTSRQMSTCLPDYMVYHSITLIIYDVCAQRNDSGAFTSLSFYTYIHKCAVTLRLKLWKFGISGYNNNEFFNISMLYESKLCSRSRTSDKSCFIV